MRPRRRRCCARRGRFAAFWNVAEPPPGVREAFRKIYVEVVPDALATRAYSMPAPPQISSSPLLTKTIEGIRKVGGFGEPEQWQFEWECVYSKDEWLDQLPTQGGTTASSSPRSWRGC